MKLIIAIVQDEDASRLISNLMSEGYSVTKLATTGGFLRAGNTTLLLGIDDEKIEKATTDEELTTAPSKPAKAQKDKKDDKKSKPGIFQRIGRWFREMKSELKKVVWPSGKQTVNNTVTVIVCVIVVGACIWIFDGLAGAIVRALLALAGKA